MSKSDLAADRPRRKGPEQLEVINTAPVWRRSLTESGMRRRTTVLDRLVVAIFVPVLVGMRVWMATFVLSHAAG